MPCLWQLVARKLHIFSKSASTVDLTVLKILEKKVINLQKVKWSLNVIQNIIMLFDYNFVA